MFRYRFLVAHIVAFGLLTAVAAVSATAKDSHGTAVDSISDVSIRADRARTFTPAAEGSRGPVLPFPGLSTSRARAARATLAGLDRQAAAATMAADRTYAALKDPNADPVPPDLPPTKFIAYETAPRSEVQIPRLAPGANGASRRTEVSTCSASDCYQSDRLPLSDPAVGLYASDYLVWLAIPQTNEQNKCDSSSASSSCFWFYAMQHHMDSGNHSASALHIGPQRGSSIAGDAGNQWRMNIDGYIDGVHIGGQSSVNLPTATWIRVRTWRLTRGYDSYAPYKPWSTWGVWAMYDGIDRYLGSITIDGHLFANSMLFSEVYEANGPCTTDLERAYLHNPQFWNTSFFPGTYASATAEYEKTCDNTTWESMSGNFVRDEREVEPRVIGHEEIVWQF